MKKLIYCAVLAICIIFPSCVNNKKETAEPFDFNDETVIMSVWGVDITYDVYRYYFLSMKVNYDTLDDKSEQDLIAICDEACLYYATMFFLAESKGIRLDDADIGSIDGEIDGYISFYGEDGYDDMLSALNHTRNSYRQMLIRQKLELKFCKDTGYSSEQREELVYALMETACVNYTYAHSNISFDTVE